MRDRELRARATESEIRALRELAKREGVKSTDMLRHLVRDAARQAGIWPVKQRAA